MRIPYYTSLSRLLDKQSSHNFNITSESYFPYETSLRVFYVVILNLFHVYKNELLYSTLQPRNTEDTEW